MNNFEESNQQLSTSYPVRLGGLLCYCWSPWPGLMAWTSLMILNSTTVGQTHSTTGTALAWSGLVWSGLSLQNYILITPADSSSLESWNCSSSAGVQSVGLLASSSAVRAIKTGAIMSVSSKNRRVAKYDGFVFVGVLQHFSFDMLLHIAAALHYVAGRDANMTSLILIGR